MRTATNDNQRIQVRVKVFQPATMESGASVSRVHLLNISSGGALVYAPVAPQVGDLVELDGLGRARVAWRDDGLFGVAFVRGLAQAALDEILRTQEDLCRSFQRRATTC